MKLQNENKYQTCINEKLSTKQIQNRDKIKWEKYQKMVFSILIHLEVSTIYLRIFGSEKGMKWNCYFSCKSKVNQEEQYDLTILKSKWFSNKIA